MDKKRFIFLDIVNSPADLKMLKNGELKEFCGQMREFIVQELAVNPGHLSSNLGAVELTTALHYVFDFPQDKIVWDVGHQAYAHKIITGRKEAFCNQRKLGGICGFPRMSEGDSFGAGHSSVSISAALGIATANKLKGDDSNVIAVIGDGAMTGGLVFEAMNNAGVSNADILVILNDNNVSIDPNVGALKKHLLRITSSQTYNKIKRAMWNSLSFAPSFRRAIQKFSNSVKTSILRHSNLFESLNFRYFGPIDGHNVNELISVLSDLKHIEGPKVLHVLTTKGKGYEPAEKGDAVIWHAPGKFDSQTGEREKSPKDLPMKYQHVFGNTLVELAEQDERVLGITAAMPTGCSINILAGVMPERCFDVGIAEAHAVTFAAGLATQGFVPFCAIYSSFLQRAYDSIIHDVALQNLHVVFCLDRAGIVGEDGATHHGEFDIAYLRCIPNMIICAPRNEQELRDMMLTALHTEAPFAIRYPREGGVGVEFSEKKILPAGKGEVLKDGKDLSVLTLGHVANDAKIAIERAEKDGASIQHIDLRWAKPLDEDLLHKVGQNFKKVVTIEDGVVGGGVGSAVLEFFAKHNYKCDVRLLGIDDSFVEHGTIAELKSICGYDTEGIYRTIKNMVG